jgi:hypothetical protein
LAAVVLCCLSAGPAIAAGESCRLTVKAGNHDRVNVPVRVLIPAAAEAKSVALTTAEGKSLVAQLTAPSLLNNTETGKRELHFILPSLEKGKSLELTAVLSPEAAADGGFAWEEQPGEFAELSYGDRPVTRYICKKLTDENREEAYKVYHHLYNPAGTQLVTKGPGGKYPHHRGIFFGYRDVFYGDGRKAGTWSGRNTPETHGGFLATEAGPVLGRHLAAVEWRGSDNEVYLNERRELAVYNVPGGTLLEFTSRLQTAGGKIRLDGNAPHAGFHFRAPQEVAEKTTNLTYYLRPDGKGELGQARASDNDLPWDAISFVLGDDRYTVLYLDKPTNPKPVEYNERTYGRFGSFFRYELDEGKDLEVNYRLWLQDGEMTVEQAAALSADFVEPVQLSTR